MPKESLHDDNQDMPAPEGHAVGFVNTTEQRDEIFNALTDAGFADASINVLSGEDGVNLWKKMMGGSLWGESAQMTLREGQQELEDGHFVLIIETKDRNEAITAANIATRFGGHGFNHFGVLVDERLTK